MRITRAVTLAVTTGTLLLGLMAPAMSTTEQAGQCDDGGTEVQAGEQGSTETVDVDGTMVTVTISDQTVSFTDSDGRPIDVTFCVKSSDDNSGTRTGSSWTVELDNGGGQTPAISHVVLYGLAETAEVDGEFSFDAELAGEFVDDDTIFTVSGVVHYDSADGVILELFRDDVPVDETTLDGSGVATVSDVLAAGEQAEYSLHIDGNEVASASLVHHGTEDVEGDVAVSDEARGSSDRLAATGVPLILVLMGLGALVAGTGVLATARRR